MPATVHTLPNDLTVLLDPMPAAHSAAAGLFFNVGARDEPAEVSGVSHFLEHMAFKGDGRLDWQQINERFDDIGAAANAYTSREQTAYHGRCLPEHLPAMIDTLGVLTRPALDPAEFETERQVILEEIAMCEDDPGHRVYDAAMAARYGGRGLGQSILGPAASIEALTPGQMRDHHAAHYHGGNCVAAVAGRFDEDRVLADLAAALEHLPEGEPRPRRERPVPTAGGDDTIADDDLSRAYAFGLADGPGRQDEARWAALLLADLLGDDEGSRLYWALVDPAVAEEAALGWQGHDGGGSFWLSVTADPGRLDEALDVARRTVADAAGDLDDDELDRAKAKLRTSLALGQEHPGSRCRRLAQGWLDRREVADVGRDLRSVEAVTRDSLPPLLAGFADATIVRLRP